MTNYSKRKNLSAILLTLCFVWLSSSNIIGQGGGLFEKNRVWMGTVGYTSQNKNQDVLELGFKRTSIDKNGNKSDGQYFMTYLMYSYFLVGSELTFNKNTQVAPKIGAGFNLLLFNFNLNFIEYNNNFKKFYPALVPEVGLSLIGLIQINYGYNFYLTNTNTFSNHNRISVRVNFFLNNKGWWSGKTRQPKEKKGD